MGYIAFKDSTDKMHLLNPIKLGQLHELMIALVTVTKLPENEQKEYINAWLEALMPDLTPYDREAAFIEVYKNSTGTDVVRLRCKCPACGESASYNVELKSAPLALTIKIPSNRPTREILFKNPTVSGGTDFGPWELRFLEKQPIPAKFVELGDTISVDGELTTYDGFQSPDVVYRERPPVLFKNLPDKTRKNLQGILASEHFTQIKSRMNSPIDSVIKVRCHAKDCKFKQDYPVKSILELIKAIVIPAQIVSDTQVISLLVEQGALSHSDAKNMVPLEYNGIIDIVNKRNKEKAAAQKSK